MAIKKNLSSSNLSGEQAEAVLTVRTRTIRPVGIPAELIPDEHPADISVFGLSEELYPAQWLLDYEGKTSGDAHAYAFTGVTQATDSIALDRALLMASKPCGEENILVAASSAAKLCIGDTLVVSQSVKSADDIMATISAPKSSLVLQVSAPGEHASSYFLRVLKGGELRCGDELVLASQPNPEWSVERVAELMSSNRSDPDTIEQLRKLASLDTLAAAGWRDAAAKRVADFDAAKSSRYFAGVASGLAAMAVAAIAMIQ